MEDSTLVPILLLFYRRGCSALKQTSWLLAFVDALRLRISSSSPPPTDITLSCIVVNFAVTAVEHSRHPRLRTEEGRGEAIKVTSFLPSFLPSFCPLSRERLKVYSPKRP